MGGSPQHPRGGKKPQQPPLQPGATGIDSIVDRELLNLVTREHDMSLEEASLKRLVRDAGSDQDAEDALKFLLARFGVKSGGKEQIRVFRHDVKRAREANTVIPPRSIVIVSFGRFHIYPASSWKKIGQYFVDLCVAEYQVLREWSDNSFLVSQFYEELRGKGGGIQGLVQWTSEVVADARAGFVGDGALRVPEQADYLLVNRHLESAGDHLKNKPVHWWDLYRIGVQLHIVRENLRDLDDRFKAYSAYLEGGTSNTIKILETTESTAYATADLLASVVGMYNPTQELACRLLLAAGFAAGRTGGKLLADDLKPEKKMEIFLDWLDQFSGKLPPIVAGYLTNVVRMPKGRLTKPLVEGIVEFLLETIVMIFRHWLQERSFSGPEGNALIRQIIEKGLEILVAKMFEAIFPKRNPTPEDPWYRRLRAYLRDILVAVGTNLQRETVAVYNLARTNPKKDWDLILLEELPWIIARTILSIAHAISGRRLTARGLEEYEQRQDKMVAEIEIDVVLEPDAPVQSDSPLLKGSVASKTAGASHEDSPAAMIERAGQEPRRVETRERPVLAPAVGERTRRRAGEGRKASRGEPPPLPPRKLPPPPKAHDDGGWSDPNAREIASGGKPPPSLQELVAAEMAKDE